MMYGMLQLGLSTVFWVLGLLKSLQGTAAGMPRLHIEDAVLTSTFADIQSPSQGEHNTRPSETRRLLQYL